jgi:hypothetical protein
MLSIFKLNIPPVEHAKQTNKQQPTEKKKKEITLG